MSSPQVYFLGSVVFDSTSDWSTQNLLLPTSTVTFWSTMARAQCGAQPEQILYGMAWIFRCSGARCCCWSAWPSIPSALLYCSLCLVLLSAFTVPLLHLLTFASLCLTRMTDSIVSVYGLSHSFPMLIRLLFCLYRFTFYRCAGSSLFDVIINAHGVTTCLPLNSASVLHQFISSVTSWIRSSSTVAIKKIPNPFKTQLNSLSIPILRIRCNLNRLISALQIRCHMHISRGWLALPIAHNQRWFSLTFACHVSIVVWNCSTFVQNPLPFKGALIKTVDF